MGKQGWAVAGLLSLTLLCCLFCTSSVRQWRDSITPKKYGSETSLRTATSRYSHNPDSTNLTGYVYCSENCPWQTYLSNSEFQSKVAYRAPFSIDDDQQVTSKRQQLACVPFTFGYSQEKGSQLFPPYVYPPCSVQPSELRPVLHLTNTSFSMVCNNTRRGKYVLHPENVPLTDQFFEDDLKEYWYSKDYPGFSLPNEGGEYALGGCEVKLTQAELVPFFREKAYTRAKTTMEKRAKGKPTRPVTVLFIAVDSFSRRHFYRKMNDTVKVMNALNADGKFAVFDFKLHNVIGFHSPWNMVPMFTNRTAKYHDDPGRKDLLGKESLWAIAKEWGFVTLIGFEYCGSNFLNFMGKRLDVDHHVSTFYCATKAAMGTDMGKDAKMQRCIGPHMSHYYLLNYTHAFSDVYRGVNQFVYVHFEAAHEETGQHAQTLDNDLATFIQQYTTDFGQDTDLAIMIQGDHGMGYGDWHKDVDADQEYKLPAMFLIAQTEFLDRIPNSFDALWHNTFRLVSKRDFRATVLSLFGEPYGGVYPVHEEKYLEDAYILTREKVKDSRVCNETHIDPWLCSCLEPTEEIPPAIIHSFGLSPVEKLLNRIVAEAVRIINEKVFTSYTFFPDFICQKVTIDEITRAYGYKINNKIEQIKVEFTINELSTARIETIALVGSDDEHTLFRRDFEWYPLDPYTYLGFPANIRVLLSQVIDITRKDKYAGPCEKLSRENGVDGEFCVCKDLAGLASDYPSLFDK